MTPKQTHFFKDLDSDSDSSFCPSSEDTESAYDDDDDFAISADEFEYDKDDEEEDEASGGKNRVLSASIQRMTDIIEHMAKEKLIGNYRRGFTDATLTPDIKKFLNVLREFVDWLSNVRSAEPTLVQPSDVWLYFLRAITDPEEQPHGLYVDFARWLGVRTDMPPNKPATQKGKLLQLLQLARWAFAHPKKCCGVDIKKLLDMYALQAYILPAARKLSRETRMAKVAELDAYPPGGMDTLVQIVNPFAEEALAMLKRRWTPATVSDGCVTRYMQTMYTVAYVDAPQGRQGGFTTLTNKDATCFDADSRGISVALSGRFKSSETFVKQPVSASGRALQLIRGYKNVVRPYLTKDIPAAQEPDYNFFVERNGQPVRSVGRKVSKFFEKYGRLPMTITTTKIRAMFTTWAFRQQQKGVISQEELTAIHNVQGHSEATAKLYYAIATREEDGRQAVEAVNRVKGQGIKRGNDAIRVGAVRVAQQPRQYHFDDDDDAGAEDADAEGQDMVDDDMDVESTGSAVVHSWYSPASSTAANTVLPFEQHGCKHPDIDAKDGGRFVWSESEKEYLMAIYQKLGPVKDFNARTLHMIRSDPEALAIFHPHHIKNAGRLRAGTRFLGQGK